MKTLVLSQQIIQFKSLSAYIGWILVSALIIRVILSLLKAAAIRQGEADDNEYKFSRLFSHLFYRYSWRARWECFRVSFFSWAHHRNIDDYGIPIYIGIIELFLYPILILANKWIVIGAWLGIKTAVQWKGWREGRTPYNRFLFGNILVIFISFFFLTKFLTLNTITHPIPKIVTELGVVYIDTPKEDLAKAGYTEDLQKDYRKEGNEEWITFLNWTTEEPDDLITFYLIDGKIKWWKKIESE